MTMLTMSTEVTRTFMFLEYKCAKHLEGWLFCTISYAYPAVSSMWFWLESVTPVEDLVPMFHWGQSTAWRQPQCQTCALDSSLCIALKCESCTSRHVKTQSSYVHRLYIYRTKKWNDLFKSYTIKCGCRCQNIAMLHSSKLEGLMLPCATDGRNWAK